MGGVMGVVISLYQVQKGQGHVPRVMGLLGGRARPAWVASDPRWGLLADSLTPGPTLPDLSVPTFGVLDA